MVEYIERNAIKYEQWPVGPLYEPIMVVRKKTIDNIPSADVAPVRHGRWVYPIGMAWNYVCSECGKSIGVIKHNYCPNCGAKMDLEDHHDSD